jgi:hypothetical protein
VSSVAALHCSIFIESRNEEWRLAIKELAYRKAVSALPALKHMIHCDISAVCDIAEVIPRSFKEGMQIFDSGAQEVP